LKATRTSRLLNRSSTLRLLLLRGTDLDRALTKTRGSRDFFRGFLQPFLSGTNTGPGANRIGPTAARPGVSVLRAGDSVPNPFPFFRHLVLTSEQTGRPWTLPSLLSPYPAVAGRLGWDEFCAFRHLTGCPPVWMTLSGWGEGSVSDASWGLPASQEVRRETYSWRSIGIGVGLAASPSHTTVHTGPYTAVR
jgi:hypothetical protein